jgi:MinD superfamily P-loop ATPase
MSDGATVIAVASGKGGTGKTTVAVNLAWAAAEDGLRVQLIDCDVEEPDAALFLQPSLHETTTVSVLVPEVDPSACTHCGVCSEACAFKAIVELPGSVLVFPELCHSCGACALLCPASAITERPRPMGEVQTGLSGSLAVVTGVLDVGEAKAPPVVRAARGRVDTSADLVVIDAPPGTSCPVIESVRDADILLLVSEPTPFGLHDLRLAVEMARQLGLPLAVVANRSDIGDDRLRDYCRDQGIEILLELPFDRRLAEVYASGGIVAENLPEYKLQFLELRRRLLALIGETSASRPAGPAPAAENPS